MTPARRRPRHGVLPVSAAAAVLALGVTTWVSLPSNASEPQVVRVAIAGDSLSAGRDPDWPAGVWDAHGWPTYANHDGLEIVGGWALSGADSAQILSHITAEDVDAFVIMAGTNDISFGVLNLDETPTRLEQMGIASGAEHVFVCALPPAGVAVGDIAAFARVNQANAAMAAANGWTFIDPFADVRDGYEYVAGASPDGVHMTVPTARIVGEAIRAAVLDELRAA